MHPIFLDLATLHPADLDLTPLYQALPGLVCHAHTPAAELPQRLAGAELVLTNKVALDAATLAAAPRLRAILVAATGYNHIDIQACRRRGILVCNARAYCTASVAEHTLALILALRRRLTEHRRAAVATWPDSTDFCVLDYPMAELAGARLGIVGLGELGRAVARLATAFGMEVRVAQRPGGGPQPGRLPLHELLTEVDILSLHCPLNDQTRGLIGADALARMRPDALLINTARGGLVDETALLAALQAGRLGGAALDVLASEPPPADHPLLHAGLPQLIITPHVAWASRHARQTLIDQLAGLAGALQAGAPRQRVV